jgi:hypothetical protein
VVTTADPPALPGPPARRHRFRHPWRVVIVGTVVVVAVNLVAFVLSESDTTTVAPVLTDQGERFPSQIETVSPFPGSLLSPQDSVTADLDNTYTGVLIIDPPSTAAFEVPEDQLDRVVDLGIVGFRPGKGKDITRFDPGVYTATVEYWPQTDERPAHPESFSWQFKVGA